MINCFFCALDLYSYIVYIITALCVVSDAQKNYEIKAPYCYSIRNVVL